MSLNSNKSLKGIWIPLVSILLIMMMIIIMGNSKEIMRNEMGYVILNFYIIFPISSFICTIVTGLQDSWIKWIMPVICGLGGCLIPLQIFSGSFDFISIFFGAIPGIIGTIIGMVIANIGKQKK